MDQQASVEEAVSLRARNIGGITETSVDFTPGVTLLTGRNATNRTSLLQALMAALGSDNVTVKGDADRAHVELTIGDATYTRTLSRQNGTISTEGDPYLDNLTFADLFAFLLETNDARQAVARGDDLREVIMQPVDSDRIETEIEDFRTQREQVDAQLENISKLERELPDKEGKRAELQKQLEAKREELSSKYSEIEEFEEQNVEEQKEERREYEEKLSELNDVRSQLNTVERNLSSHRSSLEALREERTELETVREEYEEISDVDSRISECQDRINQLRTRKNRIDTKINEIQTVIQFNERVVEEDFDVFSDLTDTEDGDLTDQLLADDNDVVCWTCGSEVEKSQIESMLDTLQELHSQYIDKQRDFSDQIDNLNQERHQLEEKQRQCKQIETQLATIDDEVQEREARIEELEARETELSDRVTSLEQNMETLQADESHDSDLLALHKEAKKLELEIEQLEDDITGVDDEIASIVERIEKQNKLEERRNDIQTEIETLRNHVNRLEQESISQFNEHMDAILDILDYDNLERIWIESTEEEVREGRQTVSKRHFDLHVVRHMEDDTVYEDTIDHLSESEREVTGLVFALAGYLVHDIYEEVPFMLLDSMEAIDTPRLSALIEYFAEYADYLVVALLEEDAQALDDAHQRVSNI